MKKERNSFFSEYGFNGYNTNQQAMMPTQNYMPNQNMIPNQNMVNTASSSFYAASYPNTNTNMNSNYNDLDARISKLERQVNRLENRINELEGNKDLNSKTDYNYSNNMYMV